MLEKIRNFCIIAHIDHGKSTLADRMLEITGTVSDRQMRSQFLDQMDLERERGITIKLQPVRMHWHPERTLPDSECILNLIDTPGHVDFSYEVSRSLAAVEGAILLVDATQGVQAQTIANLYLALEQNLDIIPVINKIDLPAAQTEEVISDLVNLLGIERESVLKCSAKTGVGVREILDAVVERVKPPRSPDQSKLRALIFDSKYNDYKGVVAYVRIVDGELKKGDEIKLVANGLTSEVLEVGYFKPQFVSAQKLSTGEIGYVVTGFKTIDGCRVGDTITHQGTGNKEQGTVIALPGYKEVQPMVFAGIYPKDGKDSGKLRDALGKLKLNDASLIFEPEHSLALGFGFRTGFLGLLHLEIVQERLKREYGLDLIITIPNVGYRITKTDESVVLIKSPQEMPDQGSIKKTEEPIVKISVVAPKDYVGSIMQVVVERRGKYITTEYLEGGRVILEYEIPLSVILVDFYDRLKSVSQGYASVSYELKGYEQADIVRLDVLVAEEKVEPFAMLVYEDAASTVGRRLVERLKDVLPRQMFEVKIQAAISGKVVASERISAMKKDVLAKMSGGDYTRKRKLLEKQKKGKSRMKSFGRVDIPSHVYLDVFKNSAS